MSHVREVDVPIHVCRCFVVALALVCGVARGAATPASLRAVGLGLHEVAVGKVITVSVCCWPFAYAGQ